MADKLRKIPIEEHIENYLKYINENKNEGDKNVVQVRQKIVTINGVQKIIEVEESTNTDKQIIKIEPKKIKIPKGLQTTVSHKDYILERRCYARFYGNISCGGGYCKAHIITRQLHALAGKQENLLILCKHHEEYFNSLGIKEWFRFVKNNHRDRFDWVISRYDFFLNEFKLLKEVADES